MSSSSTAMFRIFLSVVSSRFTVAGETSLVLLPFLNSFARAAIKSSIMLFEIWSRNVLEPLQKGLETVFMEIDGVLSQWCFDPGEERFHILLKRWRRFVGPQPIPPLQ